MVVGRVAPDTSKPESSSFLSLTDPQVSRRHAELTFDGERLYVTDLGSGNGTFKVSVDDSMTPVQPTSPGGLHGDRCRNQWKSECADCILVGEAVQFAGARFRVIKGDDESSSKPNKRPRHDGPAAAVRNDGDGATPRDSVIDHLQYSHPGKATLTGHWTSALFDLRDKVDPSNKAVLLDTPTYRVVYDGFAKAAYHLLLLPKPSDGLGSTANKGVGSLQGKDLSVLQGLHAAAKQIAAALSKQAPDRTTFRIGCCGVLACAQALY